MVARLLPLRASFQHVLLFLHSLLVKRFPGTRVHGVHGLLSKRAERTRAGSRGFTVFTSTSAILRRPLCMNSTYTALSDFFKHSSSVSWCLLSSGLFSDREPDSRKNKRVPTRFFADYRNDRASFKRHPYPMLFSSEENASSFLFIDV